jgi:hypothetical protein
LLANEKKKDKELERKDKKTRIKGENMKTEKEKQLD